MKDGLRFVDSDMHVMEPPDLFERYLDPKFRHRVTVQVGADGRPKRGPSGLTIIDGLPTSDMDLQQYRKRVRRGDTQSTQLLSGSRIFDTGRLDFAIERRCGSRTGAGCSACRRAPSSCPAPASSTRAASTSPSSATTTRWPR